MSNKKSPRISVSPKAESEDDELNEMKNIKNLLHAKQKLKSRDESNLSIKNNIHNIHNSTYTLSDTRSRISSFSKPSELLPKDTVDGQLRLLDSIECFKDVLSVRFSNDGKVIAIGLCDGQVKICKVSNTLQFQVLAVATSKSPTTALRFPESGSKKLLAVGYSSGMIHLWHYTALKIMRSVNDDRQVLALEYTNDSAYLLSGGSTSVVNMYDATTFDLLKSFSSGDKLDQMDGHKSRVFSVCAHPTDTNLFVSGGWDDTVQFWDARMKRSARHIYGPHICGDGIDIDYQHSHILTASWRKENVLQIWDYGSGDKIKDVPPDHVHKSMMYCCQWLGKDTILCGGSDSNLCRILDRGSLNTVGQMYDLQSAIYCVDNDRAPGRPRIAAGSGSRVFILRVEKKMLDS